MKTRDSKKKKTWSHVTEKLQKPKALIKHSSNNRTLDPLKDLKENIKWTVTLPLRFPEFTSNPLTRDTRQSVLQPSTRKWVASSAVPMHRQVKRSQPMSTGFEEPRDFDQSGARVPAASSKHRAGDTSHKFKEDNTVPGPSSAGQHEQVISPHIQGSLHPSQSNQGDLGSSNSQGRSLCTKKFWELTQSFQDSMGHCTSAQASHRLPTCA